MLETTLQDSKRNAWIKERKNKNERRSSESGRTEIELDEVHYNNQNFTLVIEIG